MTGHIRCGGTACVKAGLGTVTKDKRGKQHYDGLTFHGLRHTAVGFMIALGYQAAVIQKRMGHASVRTTIDVYGHLLPSTDEAVADGFEKMFVTMVESRTAP